MIFFFFFLNEYNESVRIVTINNLKPLLPCQISLHALHILLRLPVVIEMNSHLLWVRLDRLIQPKLHNAQVEVHTGQLGANHRQIQWLQHTLQKVESFLQLQLFLNLGNRKRWASFLFVFFIVAFYTYIRCCTLAISYHRE